MTATTTPRLGLYKTSSDGSDLVNVVTDLLNNWDAIDLAMGSRIVTSSTRPSTPYGGQHILESNNSYRSYVHNGTSPASAGWVEYPNNSATYSGQVWASRSADATTLRVANTFGGGNTAAAVLTEHAAAGGIAYGGRVSGDSQDRIQIRADGRIDLGPGSGARDTNLYRSGAGVLASDSAFRLTSTTDVSNSSTGHAFQIGPDSGTNLRMDNNEIQVVSNGAAAALGIQQDSGPASFFGNAASPLTYTLTVNGNLAVNGIGQTIAVIKTADESVTSSTTLQNDDHLVAALSANATYIVDGYLMVFGSTPSTGDLKFDFTIPSGATMKYTSFGVVASSPATSYEATVNPNSTARVVGTNGSTDMGCNIRAYITVSSTSGNVQLRWAQNASNGTATGLRAGSHLRFTRVA